MYRERQTSGTASAEPQLSRGPAIIEPAYNFTVPGTLLFMNGAPLTGKSAVAPLVAANIADCAFQSMDIFRLVAQEIDGRQPEDERDPILNYGSCDGYQAVGDGSYSPDNLIKSYNRYSAATCQMLGAIIPNLGLQGDNNVLFEGVQLQPKIVQEYLGENGRLIVVTSDEEQLALNREKLYGSDPVMQEQYSTERLLLLQDELLRQSDELPSAQVYRADNTGLYTATAANIIDFLHQSGTIELRQPVQQFQPITFDSL